MKCPTGDGELISHTTHGENDLTVSYSTCPTCRGYWMNSFAANFIKLASEELRTAKNTPVQSSETNLSCPVCGKPLVRATGDNIPDTVRVYRCPESHGYFFPTGQLASFKKAQHSKIEYHKLWNLPVPSVASVLLAGFLFLAVAGGLVSSLVALQNNQTVTSQARDLLISHHAYVVRDTSSVLITAETGANVAPSLSVPSLQIYSAVMTKSGTTVYTMTLKGILPGSYTYYFSMTMNGTVVRSDSYTFTMPQ